MGPAVNCGAGAAPRKGGPLFPAALLQGAVKRVLIAVVTPAVFSRFKKVPQPLVIVAASLVGPLARR